MKLAIRKLRVVLDTNVYFSGLLFGGKPATVVSKGILSELHIIISKPILVELGEKLLNKFFWPEEKVKQLIDLFLDVFGVVEVKGELKAIKRDPKDNPIIETVIKGKASYLVTGDKDILDLERYNDVEILTIDQFLKISKSLTRL